MATSEAIKKAAWKGKLKLILLALLALLLTMGASGGAVWFFLHKSPSPAPEAPQTSTPAKPAALYEPLAPAFVVNYTQNGRQRYLQLSLTLLARDAADLTALEVHLPLIRNNLVMLFSGQSFDSLETPVGMEMLRQQALANVQAVAQKELGKPVVEQVLFTNFVLQ